MGHLRWPVNHFTIGNGQGPAPIPRTPIPDDADQDATTSRRNVRRYAAGDVPATPGARNEVAVPKPHCWGDDLDGQVGRFEESLGVEHLGAGATAIGVVPVTARNRRANVRELEQRPPGEVLNRQGLVEVAGGPLERPPDHIVVGRGRHWRIDELRLPSVVVGTIMRCAILLATSAPWSSRTVMWRHRSMLAAVPAECQDAVAGVDEQDVWIDVDLRIAVRQLSQGTSNGRGPPPVEQTGLRQEEGAEQTLTSRPPRSWTAHSASRSRGSAGASRSGQVGTMTVSASAVSGAVQGVPIDQSLPSVTNRVAEDGHDPEGVPDRSIRIGRARRPRGRHRARKPPRGDRSPQRRGVAPRALLTEPVAVC